MLSLETIILFLTAATLLGFAPGPDNLFVLTQAVVNGRFAGFIVTLGLCTGLLVHTAAVVLGLAALFQASQVAFNLIKFVGVVYLLYLAWQAFRAGRAKFEDEPPSPAGWRKLYGRGILMNITNPKVSIFFLAFLPQFTSPAQGNLGLQLSLLGLLFIVDTLVVFGLICLLAGTAGRWFRQSPSAQKWLNRTAGVVFVGLAMRLALSER